MEFRAAHSDVLQQKTQCAVVPVFEGGKLSASAEAVDKATKGKVQKLIKNGDIKGKPGQALLLHEPDGLAAERLLLLGLGKAGHCTAQDFRKAVQSAAATISKTGSKNAHLFLDGVTVAERDTDWQLHQSVQAFATRAYSFDAMKSKKLPAPTLKTLTLCVDNQRLKAAKAAIKLANAIAEGAALSRDLGNLPGNVCTPTYLGKEAKKLARGNDQLSVKVLGEKQMRELGMGSLLSVAAGSQEPAQLIVAEYRGAAKSQKPTVLVGKGITFDTGGISLKPGATMDEMKFDMCGAASVIGTLKAITQLKPKLNLVCIVAAAENMPDGKATKPGDIVTSMSGKTIEVLNTDAEGRLVLCDALTYAERYKPKAVIDVATLTGACVVALGSHASGLYSNRQELADHLLAAGEASGDRAWQMPLWDEYKPQLDSNFADLANIGGPKAGSITAACFLSHFTEKYPWAHLDVAGTAWLSNADKGATGRPVPLLVHYLMNGG